MPFFVLSSYLYHHTRGICIDLGTRDRYPPRAGVTSVGVARAASARRPDARGPLAVGDGVVCVSHSKWFHSIHLSHITGTLRTSKAVL